MQPTNRRSTGRKTARQSVQLQCRRGALGLGADLAAEFLDVSEAGVKLVAKELLQPGDEVEIIMEGHGLRGPIRRLGEVRWVLPVDGIGCRIGVRFQKLISYRDVQTVSL
jgi:PilZ domain